MFNAQRPIFPEYDDSFVIFRPYFIWERKIFKSNVFLQNLTSTNYIFNFKGVTHRIQLT